MTSDSGSNVLMFVAVAAVAFALFSLVVTINKVGDINAYAVQLSPVDTGTADVEILSSVNIVFQPARSSLDWGSGSVLVDPATLDTVSSGAAEPFTDGNWDAFATDTPTDNLMVGGLVLENLGNVAVNLYVEADIDADTFICDSDGFCIATATQQFNWQFDDSNEPGSCADKDIDNIAPDPDIFWTSFQTVCTTLTGCDIGPGGSGQFICDDFLSTTTPLTNEIEIDFQLIIPISSPVGPKPQVTITATAEESL